MWQACMRVSCSTEAAYSVKALIPVKDCGFFEAMPIEYFCGLKLCPACANSIRPHDLFNGLVRDSVRQVLRAGGNPNSPDFDRAQLILISINDLQLLQLEAQNATIH